MAADLMILVQLAGPALRNRKENLDNYPHRDYKNDYQNDYQNDYHAAQL